VSFCTERSKTKLEVEIGGKKFLLQSMLPTLEEITLNQRDEQPNLVVPPPSVPIADVFPLYVVFTVFTAWFVVSVCTSDS